MRGRDIVVIGASAGGISALRLLMQGLPADFPGSLLVVVHTSPTSPGILPSLLDRAGPLHAKTAVNGERIEHGRVYVAPPNYHLLVKDQRICLGRGPKENGFRPAVDPLFRTAALNFGARVVGVVLSGGLDDGTEGLRVIKQCGGVAVVQNPEEADFPSMPASAVRNVEVDQIARVAEMPVLLEKYATSEIKERKMCAGGGQPDVAEVGDNGLQKHQMPGEPSNLTCPECGGALWQRMAGKQLRFQCHVGHVFTGDGLVAETDRTLEEALWSAVRTMEEAAELRRRMAALARNAPWRSFAPPYSEQAKVLEERAATIRALLENGGGKKGKGRGRKRKKKG